MKSIITLSIAVLLAFVSFLPVTANAQNDKVAQSTQEQPMQTPPSKAPADYKYVAQPGDSYSQMARKAVQSHGIVTPLTLEPAQIIAAETSLTIAAGSPLLAKGQIVTISQASVKAAAEAAKALPPEKVALWRQYLTGVNFNTNNIGEVRT